MLRYATADAFAACKSLGLINSGVSMWAFQFGIMKRHYFRDIGAPDVQPSIVHGPLRRSTRQMCGHCRGGTTTYTCAAFRKKLHIKLLCSGPQRVLVMGMR